MVTIITGDCRDVLKTLPDASVHCCVTSPPYWGLRDYGCEGQLGLEPTPEAYVANLVAVFREVRRVLRDDGTLWLNLGDSYANDTKWGGSTGGKHVTELHDTNVGRGKRNTGLKAKDLVGIPWRVAFALQADGWYLRQDIIWSKPNPMPESVKDRCTKAHEYIFLLAKSAKYYYDAQAIAEPITEITESSIERLNQDVENQTGSLRVPGKTNGPMKAVGKGKLTRGAYDPPGQSPHSNARASWNGSRFDDGKNLTVHPNVGKNRDNGSDRVHGNLPGRDDGGAACNDAKKLCRNKRSVWTVTTQPFKDAHFATFPPKLIYPCILAGCPERGTVLDPFCGSGTVGEVAELHGRNSILIELNAKYVKMAKRRTAQQGLFCK